MANLESTIANFVVGDHLSIERTIISVPSGTTIAAAWFTIKRRYADIDGNAIVQKAITTTPQTDIGYIDDTGGDGVAHLVFTLIPSDTIKLTPLSEYKYDIQVRLSDGLINTPESGIIVAFPQVTIAI